MGSWAVGWGWGCGSLNTDLNQVIALTVSVSADSVRQRDTLVAHAWGLTAAGDSVAASVTWRSQDSTILAVADSTKGKFVGRNTGITNIQALSGPLPSNLIVITVDSAP